MKAFVWMVLVVLLAMGVLYLASHYQGYVVVVAPPWRIETSINFAVLALLLLCALIYAVFRLGSHLLDMPSRAQAYRQERRIKRHQQFFEAAVLSYISGRFTQSLSMAKKSYDLAEANRQKGLAALVTAQSARSLRDENLTSMWLEKAKAYSGAIYTASLMSTAEAMIEFHKPQQALDSLESIGRSRWNLRAMRLALRAYQELGQWPQMLRVLRKLEAQGGYAKGVLTPLFRLAQRKTLEQMAAEGMDVEKYFAKLPIHEQQDEEIVAAAARVFTSIEQEETARDLLRSSLNRQWSTLLARAWADCSADEAGYRLFQAEEWLKAHPRDAGLQHALGRLCLKQRLWGKALSYLEGALAVTPTAQLHLELGHLHDQLEHKEEARHHYRAALNIPPPLH